MQRRTIRRGLAGSAVACLTLTGLGLVSGTAQAAGDGKKPPAAVQVIKGKQDAGPFKAGTRLTPATKSLGATKYVKTDTRGRLITSSAIQPDAGNVAGVDFGTQLNYCNGNFSYFPVTNTTGTGRYFHVVLYDGNIGTRTYYGYVSAYSTNWVGFYGVTGTTYAYLYVWNGSSYIYDESRTGSNNCSVSVSFTTASGYTGYVKYTVTNYGSAYGSVELRELAPFGNAGTYTGSNWVSPSPGGGSVVVYKYVGTGLRYGLYQELYGAKNYGAWWQYGQL